MDMLTTEIKMYVNKDCPYCKGGKGKLLLESIRDFVKAKLGQTVKLTFIDTDELDEKIQPRHIPKFEFLAEDGRILSVINGLPVTEYEDANEGVFRYVVMDILLGIEYHSGDLVRKVNMEEIMLERVAQENSALDKIKAHLKQK